MTIDVKVCGTFLLLQIVYKRF